MAPNLSGPQKAFILFASFVIWTLVTLLAMYHVWSPTGYLAELGTLMKIVASVIAFPICIAVTLLAGIFVQIVVEMVSS